MFYVQYFFICVQFLVVQGFIFKRQTNKDEKNGYIYDNVTSQTVS
jgi:hypothetical protein